MVQTLEQHCNVIVTWNDLGEIRGFRVIVRLERNIPTDIAPSPLVVFDGVDRLVKRHGGQQSPHIVRFFKRESPVVQPPKEAAIDRLQNILGIDAPPHPVWQMPPRQRHQALRVAFDYLLLKSRLRRQELCQPIGHRAFSRCD